MRRNRFSIAACPFLFAAMFVAAGACSNNGDGDRCESRGTNAGNDDCAPGLACTTGATRGDPTGPDLCCPPDRATSASAACRGSRPVIALPDAGGSDASVETDGGNVGSDASGNDGSSDAAGDGG